MRALVLAIALALLAPPATFAEGCGDRGCGTFKSKFY